MQPKCSQNAVKMQSKFSQITVKIQYKKYVIAIHLVKISQKISGKLGNILVKRCWNFILCPPPFVVWSLCSEKEGSECKISFPFMENKTRRKPQIISMVVCAQWVKNFFQFMHQNYKKCSTVHQWKFLKTYFKISKKLLKEIINWKCPTVHKTTLFLAQISTIQVPTMSLQKLKLPHQTKK